MVSGPPTSADWRLRLYALLSAMFWFLALGPGGGGTSEVGLEWTGVLVNFLLLIPLWRGARWALIILAIEALICAGVIASGGSPPGDPWFGGLTVLATAQFLCLCALWSAPREDHARLPYGA